MTELPPLAFIRVADPGWPGDVFKPTRATGLAALAPNKARYACLIAGQHTDGPYACPVCRTPFPPT